MWCALAGGVGGAKLASGLQMAAVPLTVIVNTADDFRLHGLAISPDLDTVVYTLAGLANPATGWGLQDETWQAVDMMRRLGDEPWFMLGDRDLGTHLWRTSRLQEGLTLTEVTDRMARALGIPSRVLPMTDDPVATEIVADAGVLPFQDYFVRRHQQDEVRGIRFAGLDSARPTSQVLEAIDRAEGILFCPSNPLVSIGPILLLPGVRERLQSCPGPRVAVSPLVGGRALKGPADRMLASLGHEPSSLGIARMYAGLLDGMVIDVVDAGLQEPIESLGMAVHVTRTVMADEADRARLAREVIEFARSLAGAKVS